MEKRDDKTIQRKFVALQTRQIFAVTIALFLVLLFAVLYKRPGFLGNYSKGTLFGGQIASIALFIAFTAFNWRCPSCRKFLGSDIHRDVCRDCGARLR